MLNFYYFLDGMQYVVCGSQIQGYHILGNV